ncbi:MAG: class I SAM-dependent methyltransferase [Anaerolineae bacterium]|nr:class I SAM-dependent methyltransferase [Anaerolineae bacterium]
MALGLLNAALIDNEKRTPMTHVRSQKADSELAFWQSRLRQQGTLTNDHYAYFYTAHFGLAKTFYRSKKILDIGCGPRGSLEWADEAAARIGIDPLAAAYRQLGTSRHAMHAGSAEGLPFPDASFDVVCSLNSLDHVDDLNQTIGEICRVLAPRGYFLLVTEIHRHPTVLEPMVYSWDIVAAFQPELAVVEQKQVEYTVFSPEGFGDIYQSLREGTPYDHSDVRERSGILSVRFRKGG